MNFISGGRLKKKWERGTLFKGNSGTEKGTFSMFGSNCIGGARAPNLVLYLVLLPLYVYILLKHKLLLNNIRFPIYPDNQHHQPSSSLDFTHVVALGASRSLIM